jgi:hypothetical protein
MTSIEATAREILSMPLPGGGSAEEIALALWHVSPLPRDHDAISCEADISLDAAQLQDKFVWVSVFFFFFFIFNFFFFFVLVSNIVKCHALF